MYNCMWTELLDDFLKEVMNILCFDDKSIPNFLEKHFKTFLLNGQKNILKCQYPYTSNTILQTGIEKFSPLLQTFSFASVRGKLLFRK